MRWLLTVGLILIGAGQPGLGWVLAQNPVQLKERFRVGHHYHVRARVELSGKLTPPAKKGETGRKPLTLRGESALEYDERVLSLTREGEVRKTIRYCRRTELNRNVAGRKQKQTLRDDVRRLVLLRHGHKEVPFSPDGPLLWGEIDLIRTDVFTPALAGLTVDEKVKPGDRWMATNSAVQELTDLERVDKGKLICRFEQVRFLAGRRHARVSFAGEVQGITEDGPSRQKLEGYYYFDLVSNHLSYLYLEGKHGMLDKDGREVGRVEGRFTFTRQLTRSPRELSSDSLRGLTLEPNAENTLLLYRNPALGVRFLYPRHWHVASVRGKQVVLESRLGGGMLLTVEPPRRVPTGAAFLKEVTDYLRTQKARIIRTERPRRLRRTPPLEHFALEVEMGSQKVLLLYHVTSQEQGGATVATRLPLPKRNTETTRRELDEVRQELNLLVQSVTVAKPRR